MNEFMRTVLTFLLGAGGLALINVIQERWRWRADRKAKKEDAAEEREDKLGELADAVQRSSEEQRKFIEATEKRFKESDVQLAAQSEALKLMLLDRILLLGQTYINKGEVSFDDRKRLGDMHNVYHDQLGGNGDADAIIEAVYSLPLKS